MEKQENPYENIIAVTNRKLCRGDFFLQIEKIAKLHPKAILLREKDLEEAEYKRIAKKVLVLGEVYHTTVILHTYVQAACELHCERIHVPLPKLQELGEKKSKFSLIGSSVHSVEEAIQAQSLGANYLCAGHIYQTDCKKGVPPRGEEFLRQVIEAVDIPVYGIGGITLDNLPKILKTGAAGGCMMSSLAN